MRVLVQRALDRYGYLRDKRAEATQTVPEQAERPCKERVA
jgi:hypothetical protein